MANYIPWYRATKNKQLGVVQYFDKDRLGNCYHLWVNNSLNKKDELVLDIIRVKHLGCLSLSEAVEYRCENGLLLWSDVKNNGPT